MVTVISRFRVRNGLEEHVRNAFIDRPRLVESENGFCGLEVLTDASDPSLFLLLTRWTTDAAFRAWHSSAAHHHSHGMIPRGLKLDASFTDLVVGNRVEDPAGVRNFADAVEGQTVALTRWITESDAVFAAILAADGAIRFRNRAGERIFSSDSDTGFGLTIWDYLLCSDGESLRQRLSDPNRNRGPFLINLANGQNDRITAEAIVIDCAGGFLLLGAVEQRQSQRLQEEMQTAHQPVGAHVARPYQKNTGISRKRTEPSSASPEQTRSPACQIAGCSTKPWRSR